METYLTSTLGAIGSQSVPVTCIKTGNDFLNSYNPVIVGSFEGIEKCADNGECDDTFSAQISSTGIVSGENVDWINGNASISDTSLFQINYKSGLVTTSMNCNVTPLSSFTDRDVLAKVVSSTSALSTVRTNYSDAALSFVKSPEVFSIVCQKTGADYKPKTAKIATSIGVPTMKGVTTPAICGVRATSGGGIQQVWGDCISACSSSSAYICDFVAGFWSSTPICTASSGGAGYLAEAQSNGTTSINIRIADITGAGAPVANATFSAICIGPR
jgi:hypothetical protein